VAINAGVIPLTEFIIPGSIRSKKNSKQIVMAGRYPKLLPSKTYQRWEKAFRQELWLECMAKRIKITDQPVHVQATFYYKGREPDLSGCMESLADACEGILWVDDGQIVSWDGTRKVHDKRNPRVEFSFEEVSGD